MSQVAAAVSCDDNHVFNPDSAEPGHIDSGFYCLYHIFLQYGIIRRRESWFFMNKQSYAVSQPVSEAFSVSGLPDNISGGSIHFAALHPRFQYT